MLSNDHARAGAIRCQSIVRIRRRASIVDPVVIRDRKGNYSSVVENPWAGELMIRRKRYVIPAAEYANTPAADAYQRLAQSQLGFDSLRAVAPGAPALELGDAVRVEDPFWGSRVLTVYQLAVEGDSRGVRTRLTLADPEYL